MIQIPMTLHMALTVGCTLFINHEIHVPWKKNEHVHIQIPRANNYLRLMLPILRVHYLSNQSVWNLYYKYQKITYITNIPFFNIQVIHQSYE